MSTDYRAMEFVYRKVSQIISTLFYGPEILKQYLFALGLLNVIQFQFVRIDYGNSAFYVFEAATAMLKLVTKTWLPLRKYESLIPY